MSGEGDTVNKTQKNGNKKLLVLLAFLCVIICGLVVGIIIVNNNTLRLSNYNEALDYLAEYIGSEDPNTFIEATDRALVAATNDSVKADIYLMRAGTLYNYSIGKDDEYLDQMLADAYKAESLNPTAQSAYNVSVYESMAGNEAKSEEYLKIAKERGLLDNPGRG